MILVINVCKEKIHELEFVKPIENILENSKVKYFTKHSSKITKIDLEKSDKIIICGTSLKDNEFLKSVKKFEWIKTIDKPVLGICAGMQIIGLVFGGELKKQKEIGMVEVNFKKNFLGIKGAKEIYTLHNNYVEFGKEFEIFAKTDCIQAVKFREIYGVLFHPEVRNKNIIEGFVR